MACAMLQKSALLGTALPASRPISARPQPLVRIHHKGALVLAKLGIGDMFNVLARPQCA